MSRVKKSPDHERIRCLIWLVLTVSVLLGYSQQSVMGSAYYSLVIQACGTVNSPPVILQNGTAGNSTIYTNSTSAKVNVVAPAPVPTYYPNGYNVVNGTCVSGSVPISVELADSEYFVVQSCWSSQTSTSYSPSGYNLLGSTTLDSGSVSNLVVDDGVYMTFKSSASNFSQTDNNAFIAYQAGGAAENRIPRYRTCNGSAWSDQGSMLTADSPLRWFRSVYSSLGERFYEKIVVTLSDDRYLDAYVWTGSSWSSSSNIGQVGAVSVDMRSYDVEYERTSGRALLVWSTGGETVDLKYKIWNGAAWSDAYNLDISETASGTDIYWIAMAQNPTSSSNELALIAIDGTNSDVYGFIWNGTAWGNEEQLETSVSITTEEDVAVAYEQTSGHAVFVWGSGGNDMASRQWNGTGWDVSPTSFDPTSNSAPNWIALKPDPVSDRLMLVVVDSNSNLNTADWNGTTWTTHTEHDNSVSTDAARCVDVDWEPSGSKALLIWSTDTTNLSWKTWTQAGGWTAQSHFDYAGAEAVWVQLRRDTRGVGTTRIFVSASDINLGGYTVKWNGTALSDSVTFTTQILSTTYENFDLAFQNFGQPNEYTSEVEFTGTSNTGIWTQLNWTIDSAWDTASVSITIQLYNYSSGAYPTSGDGYISYTSSSTAHTDENKNQSITNNPEDFKDSSGNWKVKVRGVKSTSTQSKLKADWIEFKPTYYSEYTVSTEFVFSNMTMNTPTQLNFTVVSEYDIISVNVIIQVWNYSSSTYVTSGEGYLAYTSTGTNVTKVLSIHTNPQFYTSSGNAKIKVTGINSTTTQFQQKINQIKLTYEYDAFPSYEYALKVVNQVGDYWTVNLEVYDNSNIGRISSLNISIHDGTSSNQIIVSGGSITKSKGEPYNLLEGLGSTVYISMSNLQASTSGTSYLYVFLKILVPSKSTNMLYVITFEIT